MLQAACKSGHLHVIRYLVEDANVNINGKDHVSRIYTTHWKI
jgi:hypothetical protein